MEVEQMWTVWQCGTTQLCVLVLGGPVIPLLGLYPTDKGCPHRSLRRWLKAIPGSVAWVGYGGLEATWVISGQEGRQLWQVHPTQLHSV